VLDRARTRLAPVAQPGGERGRLLIRSCTTSQGAERVRCHVVVALGCDRAQGYHFAAAGAPEAIEQLVLRPDVASGDAIADEQRDVGRVQPHAQ
jgi:hypothetical protein